MGARPGQGQRFPEQEGGLEEPVGDQAYPPHDALLPSPCSTGPAAGAGDGPAPLQNTVEVKWPGRWAPQGAKGWDLLEAARLASHGPAVLNAALGGDARPRQEAAEQAVGLAVNPVWDGAGAQVC